MAPAHLTARLKDRHSPKDAKCVFLCVCLCAAYFPATLFEQGVQAVIAAAADFYPTGITADTEPCDFLEKLLFFFMCIHFQRILSPHVATTWGNNLKISTEIMVIDPNWHRVM